MLDLFLCRVKEVLGTGGIEDFNGSTNDLPEIREAGNNIIKVISTAASILSVIVLVILGINYMMGSVDERAEYKKTLLPYIIGAAFVFAASTIASIIYSIAISF